MNGRCIDADLVRARIQHLPNILDLADTAAHSQGDEHLSGDFLHRMYGCVTPLVAGGDIQKGNLVRALLVVALGYFDWITGIADIDKIDASSRPT